MLTIFAKFGFVTSGLIALVAGLIVLGEAITGLALLPTSLWAWVGCLGCPALLSLPAWASLMVATPNQQRVTQTRQRRIQALLAGEHRAHWHYSPEEHRQFVRQETARQGQIVHRWLVVAVLGTLAVGLCVTLISDWIDGLKSIINVGICFVVILLYQCLEYGQLWRLADSDRLGGEVYIGVDGVYAFGRYFDTTDFLPGKRGGKIEFGAIAILVLSDGAAFYTGRKQADIRIPIPSGKQAEAEAVLQAFAGL